MAPVRPATFDDIPELVRLRGLLFQELSAGNDGWGAPVGGGGWRAACADALREQVGGEGMCVLVIDGDGGLAACGIGGIDRRLPSPFNPGGLVGHVFGIVTDPRYRKRGHARAITEELLRWFDGRGLRRVDLNASPEAQALYRSLGFEDHPDPVLSRKR